MKIKLNPGDRFYNANGDRMYAKEPCVLEVPSTGPRAYGTVLRADGTDEEFYPGSEHASDCGEPEAEAEQTFAGSRAAPSPNAVRGGKALTEADLAEYSHHAFARASGTPLEFVRGPQNPPANSGGGGGGGRGAVQIHAAKITMGPGAQICAGGGGGGQGDLRLNVTSLTRGPGLALDPRDLAGTVSSAPTEQRAPVTVSEPGFFSVPEGPLDISHLRPVGIQQAAQGVCQEVPVAAPDAPVVPRFNQTVGTADTDAARKRCQFALRALLAHLPEGATGFEAPDALKRALEEQGLGAYFDVTDYTARVEVQVWVYEIGDRRHPDRFVSLALEGVAATHKDAHEVLIRGIQRLAKE